MSGAAVKMLISDFIVIWRAWAFIPDERWAILVPFILWIGAVGEWSFFQKAFPFAEFIHP